MLWSTNSCSRAAVAPQTDGRSTSGARTLECHFTPGSTQGCSGAPIHAREQQFMLWSTNSYAVEHHFMLWSTNSCSGAPIHSLGSPNSCSGALTHAPGLLLHHKQTVAPQTDCCNANRLPLRCNSTTRAAVAPQTAGCTTNRPLQRKQIAVALHQHHPGCCCTKTDGCTANRLLQSK